MYKWSKSSLVKKLPGAGTDPKNAGAPSLRGGRGGEGADKGLLGVSGLDGVNGARGGTNGALGGTGGGGAVKLPSGSGVLRANEHWVLQMLSRLTASTPTSAISCLQLLTRRDWHSAYK